MSILLVVIILVVLIVVHEFGHFIAAKLFGIKVEEFGIGYPPRAVRMGKIGETEYTLNWIPFGGFVRLYGEEAEVHGPRSFSGAKGWKQAIVLLAGVAMNAILAYALFTIAVHTGIPRVVDTPKADESAELIVADVVPGSPADILGIKPGDQIVGIQDPAGASPHSLTPEALSAFVSSHGGTPLALEYLRNAATTSVQITPANGVVADAGRPAIGIGLALVTLEGASWLDSFPEALTMTKVAFETVGSGLWTLASGAVTGHANLSDVVGPVGLVQVVGQASRSGVGEVLSLAGLISINLVFVNLLPVPVLDGGRFLMVVIEMVTRRSISRFAMQLVTTVGLALIILLMVAVTYHDVLRLILH